MLYRNMFSNGQMQRDMQSQTYRSMFAKRLGAMLLSDKAEVVGVECHTCSECTSLSAGSRMSLPVC